MRDTLLAVAVVAIAVFVIMRIRVLEEKLGLLRRSMDRHLGEQDIEHMVKVIRENTADALEDRLLLLEAQAKQHAARLNGTVEVIRPDSQVGTSTLQEELE